MANLARFAKPSCNWTLYDLNTYHISLDLVDCFTFFGLQELPQPSIDQELLNILEAKDMQQDHLAELITLLDLCKLPTEGENNVHDFIVKLFKVLGYVHRQQVACTLVDLRLLTCGEIKNAKTDVCLVDCSHNDILLVVQAERRMQNLDFFNVQAQLVAEAVAAFNENNLMRLPQAPMEEKVMPGIVMLGTLPLFFKIPVTQTLSTHISNGTYPPEETHVTYCFPIMPCPTQTLYNGMKPLDSRCKILKCFEAFKMIVGI